jgi:flagellar M-ring protein FliF
MLMAESGLPRGGSVGYEIFDRSEALGTSSFTQNMNQLRALEGELSRTIGSLAVVESARVHLVLPKREMFSRERQEASASIVLLLRGRERLGKNQIAAVQHLVAAAVPGLKPSRISIIDQEGNLLARGNDEEADVAGATAEELRAGYETRLARTVEEMLERSVGPGKARVEVRADMDFDRVTTNSETFDPEGQVVRSQQTVSETSDNSENGDQPVTVANNLPDAQASRGSGGTHSKSARNEETVNYEVTKTVKSHVREGGVVRRLSVAVLVDGTYAAGADGTRAYQPRSAEELQKLNTLVRSAIGFNAQRGDTVEVVNLRFINGDEPPPPPEFVFLGMTKADLMRLVETGVLGIVGLLVVLLVVRPLLMRALENAAAVPALPAEAEAQRLITDQTAGAAEGGAPGAAGAPALAAGSQIPIAPGTAQSTAEAIEQMIDINQVEGRVRASSIKKIGEIVDKHPDEAIAIIRAWMYQNA